MKRINPPGLGALLGLGVLLVAGACSAGATGDRVDFNRHVRPLLSDRCFKCHGPDEQSRKAKLRLDLPEGLRAATKAGQPIVQPGNPEASELVRRILTADADDLMPPPESKLALSTEEKELLQRWVLQGAEYRGHWAFVPVGEVAVPESKTDPWVRNGIDAFVLEQLRREGLEPAKEAPRETLIRRLAFDLTGLPPALESVDAFLADPSPAAYEAVVDRLLASPHYGEWMAVEWMDLARFADTYGYQADVEVDLSPWRDWVIRAFNGDLPFDQFLTWQLAGDLLPDPTRDQRLATAFNRLHRQTNEGGSVEEEWRSEYVADRVNTFGTAMLGLTLECARCHDHKYDPISQRDYYALIAFFNSVDESGLYSHFTRATPTPVLLLWSEGQEAKHREVVASIMATERRLHEMEASAEAVAGRASGTTEEPETAATSEAGAGEPGWPDPLAHFRFESVTNQTTAGASGTNVFAQLHDGPELVEGRVGRAMKFSGDNSAVIQGAGMFQRTDPFSFALWLKPAEAQARAVVFHCSRSWTDSGSRGYELLLDHGRPWFALIHFWPGNAIAVRAKEPLPTNAWSHLAITYDGSSRADGLRLYRNGGEIAVEVIRDHLYKDILHKADWGDGEAGQIRLALAGRFRDSGFKHGLIDEFTVFASELTPIEVAQLPKGSVPHFDNSSSPQADGNFLGIVSAGASASALVRHRLARHDPEYQALVRELKELRDAENDLITPVREIMTMEELAEPRPTFVLRRGAYDAPGDRVERDTPSRIMPWPEGAPRNRLGLAAWVTDPRNPLPARVAVNRVWKLHFGRGLVPTTWDFGAQGQLPSHPELLDWLARRFMESGWDRKALHQLIVSSATYRQSSVADARFLARDPDNRLLARGPKHRLAAEQVRDGALAVSGLLNPAIGGPSVKPYQPPGVWEESGTGKSYAQDKGDKLHRRSLYTFWRRTAPPPAMLTFDATTREVCTAKREVTATPLQALVLLNDVQFLEAARVLAEQLVTAHPDDPGARAREAFRRLTGRTPDEREAAILTRLYVEQLAWFEKAPDVAAKFVTIGEVPRRDPGLPAAELAATTVLASTLMNFDEFVMKR